MERHANDQEGQEKDKSFFPDQKSKWEKPQVAHGRTIPERAEAGNAQMSGQISLSPKIAVSWEHCAGKLGRSRN
jgi:hypothetical protein